MYKRRFPLMDKAGDGSGAGGGDEEGKKVDLTALANTVVGLVDAVKGITENNSGVSDTLKGIQESLVGLKPVEKKEPESKSGFGDVNLEAMDRKGFAEMILGQVGQIVKDALKPVGTRIDDVSAESTKTAVAAMVKEARANHPDIDEWIDEVKGEMQASPGLSLQKALTLVKQENPDKAKETAKKFEEESSTDGRGSNGDGKKRFGGLPPGGSQTEASTRMGADDAAEAAWETALSNVDDPSILNSDGN